jgi:hypothetical protein
MPLDASALPKQFRYWAIHGSLNALPSFIIACKVLGLWKQPLAIAAMLCAVATFIAGYTLVSSLRGPLSDPSHLLHRSIRVGAKIRMFISAISIPVALSNAILLLPDFWCGFFAVNLTNGLLHLLGSPTGLVNTDLDDTQQTSFFAVYASTMVEGLILSFGLLMISFFSLVVLQFRERRKEFGTAQPQG